MSSVKLGEAATPSRQAKACAASPRKKSVAQHNGFVGGLVRRAGITGDAEILPSLSAMTDAEVEAFAAGQEAAKRAQYERTKRETDYLYRKRREGIIDG